MTANVKWAVAPATALSVLLLTIAVRAGQTTIAKPLIPVAASTLADTPDTYVGQLVTVTGAVEQTLSKSVFSIDQDKTKSTGRNVLVIAPSLNGTIGLNAYVTVVGEVVRFSASEIAQRLPQYVLDLTPDLISKYEGIPTVLATAVVDTALVDLARKVPPPLTPEEEAFDKVMKATGPAFTTLRQTLTDTDADSLKTQTVILRRTFSDTQAFWKGKGTYGCDRLGNRRARARRSDRTIGAEGRLGRRSGVSVQPWADVSELSRRLPGAPRRRHIPSEGDPR